MRENTSNNMYFLKYSRLKKKDETENSKENKAIAYRLFVHIHLNI